MNSRIVFPVRPDVAIVLTASVSPSASTLAVSADVTERLHEYRAAIQWWSNFARDSDYSLYVVETSGAEPATLLGHDSDGGVTFHSHSQRGLETERGKGYLEARALESLFTSHPELGVFGTVYKVTGRLIVTNAHRCVTSTEVHSIRMRTTLDNRYADTRLVGMSGIAWARYLNRTIALADDESGIYIEHCFALQLIEDLTTRRAVHEPFPLRPRFVGRSGTTGQRYGSLPLDPRFGRLGRASEALLRNLSSHKQA